MPQIYDKPLEPKPKRIKERFKGWPSGLMGGMPMTTSYLTSTSPKPTKQVKELAPALESMYNWVNERESFALEPGTMAYARQSATMIDDPDNRADALSFIDKLQAMPVDDQKIVMTYLRGGAVGAEPRAAFAINPETGRAEPQQTTEQLLGSLGLGIDEQGLTNFGVEQGDWAGKLAAIRAMFPAADLTADLDQNAYDVLNNMYMGTYNWAMQFPSLKSSVEYLRDEVSGRGLEGATPKHFLGLYGRAGGGLLQVGTTYAGQALRNVGAEGVADELRNDAEAFEETLGVAMKPVIEQTVQKFYGLKPGDPGYDEAVIEIQGALNVIAPVGGAIGGAILGRATRRLKYARSIAATPETIADVLTAKRNATLRTGPLGTAAEVYRLPARKITEKFDGVIQHFLRDPEDFFTSGINGRGGRRLMGSLAAAKEAHPGDIYGQVGFMRELYGTQIHERLVKKMLEAGSSEEAKHIFITTVTSPGGATILDASGKRLTQIAPRLAELEDQLNGVDRTAKAPRIREIEDRLHELDEPTRAAQRGDDFLDYNRGNTDGKSLPAIREEIEVQKLRAEYESLAGKPYERVERVPADGTETTMSMDEIERLKDPELWDERTSQGYSEPEGEGLAGSLGEDRMYLPQRTILENVNNSEATNAGIRQIRQAIFAETTDDYFVYHWTNADNLPSIAEGGLESRLPADAALEPGNFPEGAYFSNTGEQAYNLLPMARARDAIVLRTRRAASRIEQAPSGYEGEFLSRNGVPADRLEYLAEDGIWTPVTAQAEGGLGGIDFQDAVDVANMPLREVVRNFASPDASLRNLPDNSSIADLAEVNMGMDLQDLGPQARIEAINEVRLSSEPIGDGVYHYEGDQEHIYYTSPDGQEVTAYLAFPNNGAPDALSLIHLTSRRGTNDGAKLLKALVEEYNPTPQDLLKILHANVTTKKGTIATWQALKAAVAKRKKIGKLSPEDFAALKADIQANGIHTPLEIDVDPSTGKAVMSEGFHRYLAAKELGMQEVPVKVTYAKGVDGPDFSARPEVPSVDPAMRESLMTELAQLRIEQAHHKWTLDTSFDDNPHFYYPERKFVRAVVRQPVTKLERRIWAMTNWKRLKVPLAKFVDDLPSRPQLYVHGLDGNPADFLDQNTAVLSEYMRRAGVDNATIQRRLGELGDVTDADAFYELIERKIFGKNGDIDLAMPSKGKGAVPIEVRDKIINLHHKPVEERTHSRISERVNTRMGEDLHDTPLLGKKGIGTEVTPLPSDPTEFLQTVTLPDVDLLIEATSSIRRMVRYAEQSGGPGNVAAKAAWSVPRFAQTLSTAVLKPLVMLVRLPAMGMRIQMEQALRMASFGYKPIKGLPDGMSLLPGGIPITTKFNPLLKALGGGGVPENVRLLQNVFGEDGWRLLDPDPNAPGFSKVPDNSDLGMFMDEVGETKPMTYRWESTADYRSGRRQPGKPQWEGVRYQLDRAHKSWLDRAIAQKGLNREAILRFLENDPVAKQFMQARMNKQLLDSTFASAPEGLDGKVIQMSAAEAAEYVEFPDRLRGTGRTPEQNADISESIAREGYNPDYIGPSGVREGNIVMEVDPNAGTAIIREKHHRIGAAADLGQDVPVEIRIVDHTQAVRGINIDETPDDALMGALSDLAGDAPDVGKHIDLKRLTDSEWSGSEADILRAATEKWVDAKIERIRQITNNDPDFIDAIATGEMGKRGVKTLDPDGRPYAMDYNVAANDVKVLGEEIRERVRSGVLVNGTDTEKAMVAVLQRQQRDAIGRLRALEASHPDLEGPTVKLTDKHKFRNQVKDRWETGKWEFPDQIEVGKRTGPEQDLGLMGDIEHYAHAVSGIMYKGFRPLSYVDKHGTRGSLFTQEYRRMHDQALIRGYSGDVAKGIAHAEAGRITRDLMYDLNARSSMQRALKDIFWFAPATQEVLYTWLVKVPAQSYWPIGAVALGSKVVLALGLLEGMGIIKEDANGEKVIEVPGMEKLVDLLPGDANAPDIAFGKALGLNLVTTGGGVPGLSIQANFVVGAAAKKWGGPFKAISDAFQPYGPESTVLPMPITYLHEALFGGPPPWEFLSPDYQKAQWDRTFDSGIQYAFAELTDQGILPPKPEEYGDFDKASGTWDLTPEDETRYKEASEAYWHQLFGLGQDYARGQAWVRFMGSTVAPMSLYTTSEEKEAWTKFWNESIAPEGFPDGLSQAQTETISGYLEDHPNSIGFATFTSLQGKVTKELPFDESLDDAWYDAYYTGERRTATPEEFTYKVMASESRRHYQSQLDTAQRAISPELDPWELLTSGNERNRALAIYSENWDRYKKLNPEVATQLELQSHYYSQNNDTPVQSFEAERLQDTMSLLKQIAPMMTGEDGIRPTELREVQGKLAELYSEEGTFGEPRTETAKAMGWWYDNVMDSYLEQTAPLYEAAQEATNLGLDASSYYDQIRAISNQEPPKYHGETVPSAEEVFFGNRTPEEQEAARNGWASRPVTWLSDFQRETVGYNMTDSTKKFLNDMAEYDNQFWDYINDNQIQPSSLEYERLQDMRDSTLEAAAAGVGPEASKYYALNEAPPYIRLTESGFGADQPTWQNSTGGAKYVIDLLESKDLSAKGFSEDAIAQKTWFYTSIEEARDLDPDFDRFMEELKYSFPLPNGGWRDGVTLYEAVYFGNFNQQYIPESLAQLGA